jgi:hypothetical protein
MKPQQLSRQNQPQPATCKPLRHYWLPAVTLLALLSSSCAAPANNSQPTTGSSSLSAISQPAAEASVAIDDLYGWYPKQTDATTWIGPSWDDPSDSVPWVPGTLMPSIRDRFELSEEQMQTIIQAENRALDLCLEPAGFDYIAPPPGVLPDPKDWIEADAEAGALGIGLLDPDYAAAWGYGTADESWGPDRPEPPEYEEPNWTAEQFKSYQAALQQCQIAIVAEAPQASAAAPDGTDINGALGAMQEAARAAAGKTAEVKQVFQEWSTCMKQAGYSYDNPGQPYAQYADLSGEGDDQAEPLPPDPLAKATAIADTTCKQQVGLVKIYREALWQAEDDQIAANRPTIEVYWQQQQNQLRTAQEYLAKHPE